MNGPPQIPMIPLSGPTSDGIFTEMSRQIQSGMNTFADDGQSNLISQIGMRVFTSENNSIAGVEILCITTEYDPQGNKATFKDSRYWVRSAYSLQREPGDPLRVQVRPQIDSGDGTKLYFVATNTAEMKLKADGDNRSLTDGTHLVPAGTPVWVRFMGADMVRMPLLNTISDVSANPANNAAIQGAFSFVVGGVYDAIITAKTAINGVIRWKYTIELGHWDMADASTGGTWVSDNGALVQYAFNGAEDKNTFTGSGTIGTGNTASSTDGTINGGSCVLLALPIGGYVQVKYRGRDINGVPYWTIVNAMNSAQ